MTDLAHWKMLFPVAVIGAVSSGHAATYLTIEQTQRLMFPSAAAFADRAINLSPPQRAAIKKASGMAAPKIMRIWEARSSSARLGWVIVDQVLGKHELITYAVALDPNGTVRRLEILDYRETYGGEIRNEKWRQQFVGKRNGAAFKLDGDIRNISGATLSCRHVTDGVKRLLATYDLLLRNL